MISRLNPTKNKAILILLLSFLNHLNAQKFEPYIGVHGGINFSFPISIGDNQQIITLLNGEEVQEKSFTPLFKNFGHQIGFSIFLSLNKRISIGFLPELVNYSFGYKSSIAFFNNQGDSSLLIDNTSKVKLNYINLPLVIQYQYEFDRFSPYLFVGASYGLKRNIQHRTIVHSQIYDHTIPVEFSETTTDNYSSEYIRSKINLLGGIGIKKDFSLFFLALDFSYWLGMHNLINESGRYNTQTISGTTYDIPNDLKLNHLVANLSILFPINKTTGKNNSKECEVHKKKR